ncbi:hypothetical protein HPP92_014561 [Vanilla planifolia]|uniref:Lethal giant larvae (Lgl)-like C-terminal domain-containing protein n=1 Tax=Vanilla planifolia TaxID=51239 RepID=A0A835UR81_VANPL|nr:hypothetical protein HPP92_014561 [Vanilla planifolia]
MKQHFSEITGLWIVKVIILNDKSESRTVKLGIPLTEACIGMEIISSFVDVNKQKKDVLVLLLKSGHLYLYNDSEIESYLLKSQSKSNPSPPNHVMAKLPYYDRRITSAKLYASFLSPSSFTEEDNVFFPNKFPHFLSVDRKENMVPVSARFEGFAKIKRFYITGHQDGAINFWDASFPLFVLMLSIKPQSEEGSATSVTALHFELSSQVLICGDQSGSVRIISFKREQTASEHILSFLQAKQGANYTIQTTKLKGAILSLSINPESKHLAIGTDKGYVFVIDIEGSNILYQKQFPTQIYSGVISLQFENCNHNGYVKNVLLVATEESSVIAVEEDSGNELSSNGIHTKKPCRCLLMQILDVSPDGMCIAHCKELNQENHDKDNASNQSLLLLCSENTVRIYSLNHAVQGIKKSHCKKKLSGSCCFASIICGHSSEIGLALFFTTGKLEIRSLPDLTLLKESTARGVINSTSKPSPNLNATICSSSDGELIIVTGDQEISIFSVLLQNGFNRNVESINKVYRRDVVMPQESSPMTPKEKKKGIFSMVVKDSKASKSKNKDEHAPEDSPAVTLEELAAIFSTANFPLPIEGINDSVKDEEKVELDINDIELEDNEEKPKGMNFSILTKQNLGKKLQEIRGILKPKSDEKLDVEMDKNENEKATGSVNQIKKKYGYAASNESNASSIAKEKLKENTKKLQDTGARSSEMHDTARSFSSMAKELLRISHK